MNKSANNLQDVFLNQARKNRISVTIHLINGFQLKGFVKGFDNFTIILDNDGKQVMIYKHAVSTITPLKPVLYTVQNNEIGESDE
ncbi:RNA chaperone Hfq [Fonticella tunisiensis]|uniref:RNA-binding protein Hfq n=1 Tax=Fonticella tunisiensis TaxID=1096341 RepID=A0A4R7KQN9_9CLOT|nr:RNA chaperone Hfq [Fonticella tunisiensis]TDT61530.1 RNA-binding protein Hfq [Fonticella tunisiensis]